MSLCRWVSELLTGATAPREKIGQCGTQQKPLLKLALFVGLGFVLRLLCMFMF